jgi:ubiquinone/menaquinone biosynthesis C-methylase UbiE
LSPSLPDALPDYADALLAYHRSHAETLREMMSRLPIAAGQCTLDVATGDGTYAILMAQRGAEVVALDQDPNYLSLTTTRAARRGLKLDAVSGDACDLPFADDHFDGVFCAQSFYSISNVSRVLSEMRRVVKPGGWVGVLENDSLHHVLLPWPADLELAVRLGQYTSLAAGSPKGERYYIGRRLFSVLRDAGFEAVREASFATQHTAPLTDDALTFLREHAIGIIDQARPHLAPATLHAAESSCDPASADYLFTRPDFSATVLDLLVWGAKPH